MTDAKSEETIQSEARMDAGLVLVISATPSGRVDVTALAVKVVLRIARFVTPVATARVLVMMDLIMLVVWPSVEGAVGS